MFFIGALTFLFSYVSTFDLRNKTACFPHPFIMDPPCESTEMILPKHFILAQFSNKTCQGKISNNPQQDRDLDVIKYCCQLHWNDHLTEYCLPSEKSQIPHQPYRELIDSCTGRQTCSLDGNGKAGYDYIAMEYQCIPKLNALQILENSSITDKTVFLYNNQPFPPSGRHCVAYSLDCEATLTVKTVASNIPNNHCNITYSENKVEQSRFSCSYLDQHVGCQPTYNSSLNFVNIHIDISFGSKSLLWLDVQATSENVTVECGESIPVDVPRGCPTTPKPTGSVKGSPTFPMMTKTNDTMKTQSTSPITANTTLTTNDTPTARQLSFQHSFASGISTDSGQETSSYTTDTSSSTISLGDVPLSKQYYITVIGTSVGGIAVLLLIGLAFLCYRRRRGTGRGYIVKKNSKTELLRRQISYSDRESVTCDNPIYETDDFKLKVRDSMVKDDDKVKCDQPNNRNYDPYATIEGDKPFETNALGRTDLGDKPFGTDLKIKRNSWVNSCPDFLSEMAVSQSLAKLDDILNAEESRGNQANQANDVYAKVLPKEEQNKGTRPGNGELSDMYAKVVPRAYR